MVDKMGKERGKVVRGKENSGREEVEKNGIQM